MSALDIAMAQELGYTIKLLAVARDGRDAIEARLLADIVVGEACLRVRPLCRHGAQYGLAMGRSSAATGPLWMVWARVGKAPAALIAGVNPQNKDVPADWSKTRTR